MNASVTWGQIIAAYMPAVIIMATITLGILSNNRHIELLSKNQSEQMAMLSKYYSEQMGLLSKRIDRLDDDLSQVKSGLTKIAVDVVELKSGLKEILRRFDKIEGRLESKVVVER